MRSVARALVLVVAVVAGGVGFYVYRNPERVTLDDAARANVGGRFVRLTGGVTHYELAGPDTGRVVVLVHGRSVPYYIWDSTAAALPRAGVRVLRYDLFGRGYSDRPNVDYTPALLDRQLVELLDSLRIADRIDLIGLSMGGLVVANFANHHAGRLRTLTLMDPVAGGRGSLPLVMRVPGLREYLWQTTVVPGMADGQTSDFVHPERFPDWVARYRPQMRYRGFGRAMLSTALQRATVNLDSVYRQTGALTVPVLLLWGREDRTVPFARSADVRRDMPRAQFVPIAGAAHLPAIEQSAETHDILVRFLRAH